MCKPARILLLLLICPSTSWAQATAPEDDGEIDWQSALIIHFDAASFRSGRIDKGPDAVEDSDGVTDADAGSNASVDPDAASYIAGVRNAIETGWLTAVGADAVAIGPVSPLKDSSVPAGSARAAPYSLEPLGSASDWSALRSAAEEAGIALVLILGSSLFNLPSEQIPVLAEWMARHNLRRLILEGARQDGAPSASDLRKALELSLGESVDASGDGVRIVWIATSSNEGSVHGGPFDAVLARPFDDQPAKNAEVADLVEDWTVRSSSSDLPIISVLGAISDSDLEDDHRLLFLPGSLLISTRLPDSDELPRWAQITAFRQRHPAMSMGEHEDLPNTAYSFARTYSHRGVRDAVIVAFGTTGTVTLNVSRIFSDNALLRDSVTGGTAFVSFGMATFVADPSGLLLIEEAY